MIAKLIRNMQRPWVDEVQGSMIVLPCCSQFQIAPQAWVDRLLDKQVECRVRMRRKQKYGW